ncbi:DUF924 family protein [Rhodobaculum claviforme]|uniref:DUF924 domain-containing protein n=1 Tax=Rhodobaculum claviforme TaxID=1549854 RepID=A0A934WIC5_9RHOB|nr:DUF924 family protein [Rhodobaculum claviforme]MBK5928065.1 hypothetical protein [Rhodobaculum claviforme]
MPATAATVQTAPASVPAQIDAADEAAHDILAFWIDEVGPEGWYSADPDIDAAIRDRWEDLWKRARCGLLEHWLASPRGALAYIILTDQFPRNMFRDDARAFATDAHALNAAIKMIWRRWDMRLPEPERQFFYLPLMHSESQSDQDRCVRLMITRMPDTGFENLLHARAHREVIRRFGRFPHRNGVLSRPCTTAETRFLDDGGYGAVVRALRAA